MYCKMRKGIIIFICFTVLISACGKEENFINCETDQSSMIEQETRESNESKKEIKHRLISFDVTTIESAEMLKSSRKARIIKSSKELKEESCWNVLTQNSERFTEIPILNRRYNDDWFAENSLIIFNMKCGSTTPKHEVKVVGKSFNDEKPKIMIERYIMSSDPTVEYDSIAFNEEFVHWIYIIEVKEEYVTVDNEIEVEIFENVRRMDS